MRYCPIKGIVANYLSAALLHIGNEEVALEKCCAVVLTGSAIE
jgi:hypothetical protein